MIPIIQALRHVSQLVSLLTHFSAMKPTQDEDLTIMMTCPQRMNSRTGRVMSRAA